MRRLVVLLMFWGSMPVILIDPFYGVVYYALINIIRPEQLLWGDASAVGRIFLAVQAFSFTSWVINKNELTPEYTPTPSQIKILGLVAFGMIIATINAFYPDWSWYWTSGFLKLSLLCFILSRSINTAKKLERYYAISLVWWSLLAIWGIQQKILGNTRMEGLGGDVLLDANLLSAVFVLYLPMTYYMLFSRNKKIKYFIGIPSVMIFVIFIIFGESRGAFLGMVGCLGIIFLKSKGAQKIKTILAFAVMGGLLIVILVNFFPPEFTQEWLNRLGTLKGTEDEYTGEVEREGSSATRLSLWKAAIVILRNNPQYWPAGIGMNSFIKVYGRHADELALALDPDDYIRASVFGRWSAQLHNTYLGVLIGGGLAVFPIWLFLIFYSWLQAYNIPRKYPRVIDGVDIHNYARAIEVGIVGYCICIIFVNMEFIDFFYWHLTMAGIITNLGKAQLKREALGLEDEEFEEEPQKLAYLAR